MIFLKLGWFLAMSFVAVVLAAAIVYTWPPRMGLDLAGGVRLVYAVDREALAAHGTKGFTPEMVDWDALERALRARIDPSATGEGDVRHLPPWQMEVVIPSRKDLEIDRIKKLIGTSGVLELRIVANPVDHQGIIDLARQQAADDDTRGSSFVRDGDVALGYWSRVGRESEPTVGGIYALKVEIAGDVIRDAGTGQLIELPSDQDFFSQLAVERYFLDEGIEEVDVLMATDDGFDVTGAHLAVVSRAWDETARPCVNFSMTRQGAGLMAGLTGSNLPDLNRSFYRRLGIMLDGTLLTAPRIMSTISDRGRITGSFTQEEVDFLVGILNVGSLPVPLQRVPMSESNIDPVPQAARTIGVILWIACGLLVLTWIVMVPRHGLVGAGGSLASLVQVLGLSAAILVFSVSVTVPMVLAAALTVLLAAVGNEMICEFGRRGMTSADGSRRSAWRGLVIGTAPVAFLFGLLAFSGVVAYVLGSFSLRTPALALLLGSLVALPTSCICLPALIALVIAERRNRTDEADGGDVLTATLA